MSYLISHWQPIVIAIIGLLTVIQEILSLMGHGSGAITAVISFLNQISGEASPSAPIVPPSSPTPPAASK